eukprot:EG_transcript_10849
MGLALAALLLVLILLLVGLAGHHRSHGHAPAALVPVKAPQLGAERPDGVAAYVDGVLREYARTKDQRRAVLISNHPSTEGLGSRMTGFLSAFYVALALNFSLAVHWSVRPRVVEGRLAQMAPLEQLFATDHSLVPISDTYTPNRTMFLGYGGVGRLHKMWQGLEFWGCADFVAGLQNLTTLKLTTTVWMLPLIRRNPAVQRYEWVRRTAFHKGLYRQLAAFLFRPARDVAEAVRHLAAEQLAGVSVCIHARSQDGGLLRKAERCLRTAVRLASNRSSAARIYLASDNEQFRARIVEKYPGQVVTSGKKVHRKTDSAVREALVELLLLQRCRGRAVYTPESTFSVLAFAGDRHLRGRTHRTGTCEPVELFEPCFRLWHFLRKCKCHQNRTVPWTLAWRTRGFGIVDCITEVL